VLVREFHHSKAFGWTMTARDTGWVVATVDERGPAAGRLEPDDRLLALNGDGRVALLGYLFFANAPVGEIYRLDVDRRGTRTSVDLLMAVGPGRQMWLVFLTVSIAFFAVGAALGVLRPEDPQVRLITALMIAAACGMILEVLGGIRTFLVGWDRSVHLAVAATSLFVFPMTFHFFSRFPEWKSPVRSGAPSIRPLHADGSRVPACVAGVLHVARRRRACDAIPRDPSLAVSCWRIASKCARCSSSSPARLRCHRSSPPRTIRGCAIRTAVDAFAGSSPRSSSAVFRTSS